MYVTKPAPPLTHVEEAVRRAPVGAEAMLGIMEPPLHVLLKATEEQHDIGLALYVDGGDAPVGVKV